MKNIKSLITPEKGYVVAGAAIYIVISLLIIFYRHHYWDDEIFNLSRLNLSYVELIDNIKKTDIHPPGQYLINKIIYDAFHSYKIILLFSILFNVAALVYFYFYAERYLSDIYAKLFLFMSIFLNGGMLMWTNSVRWYAYWTPLFIFISTYILKLNPQKKISINQAVVGGVFLSIMTYIEYMTFILIISVCVLFVSSRREVIFNSIKNIFLLFIVYFSLSIYNIYTFALHFYFAEKSMREKKQILNFIKSILSMFYSVMNGGSVFIADPFFILFSFSTAVILLIGMYNMRKMNKIVFWHFVQNLILFTSFSVLIIFSGVPAYFRYSFFLTIPFFFIISVVLNYINNSLVKKCYLFVTLILLAVSINNLVTRHDTAKNSYNLPVVQFSDMLKKEDGDKKIIFTHEPGLKFHLANKKYNVYDMYDGYNKDFTLEKGAVVYTVRTYQGSFTDQKYRKVLSLYAKIESCMKDIKKENIGIDKYYKIKNKIGGSLPKFKDQYQMHISFGEMKNICFLPANAFPNSAIESIP